jgi:hypothetical protein
MLRRPWQALANGDIAPFDRMPHFDCSDCWRNHGYSREGLPVNRCMHIHQPPTRAAVQTGGRTKPAATINHRHFLIAFNPQTPA